MEPRAEVPKQILETISFVRPNGTFSSFLEGISIPIPAHMSHARSAPAFGAFPGALLVGVPDVGRDLPLAADFLPDHNVFSSDLLRLLALGLQGECPDLLRRVAAERLDALGGELQLAGLHDGAGPERLDSGPSGIDDICAGWEQDRILRVEVRDRREIA